MRKLQGTVAATLFLLFLVSLSPANAQGVAPSVVNSERYDIERYLNIRTATAPTLSPAGDRIAFLTNITGTPQVWTVDARGGWPEQLTFYADRVELVKWSPDGSGLVFAKSKGGDENAQLFWLSPDGSKVHPLTDNAKVSRSSKPCERAEQPSNTSSSMTKVTASTNSPTAWSFTRSSQTSLTAT